MLIAFKILKIVISYDIICYICFLCLGSLVANMIHKIQSHIKHNDNTIAIYSAHDVTLVNFLRALGYDELIKPAYGATIGLELDQITGMAPTLQVANF